MLNASDAFFSVLRPADDRGWARTLAALATAVPGRSAFWVYEPAANASANALAAAVAASDAWSGSGVMIAGARKPKDDYAADALDAARRGRVTNDAASFASHYALVVNPWADDLDAVDGLVGDGPAAFHAFYDSTVASRPSFLASAAARPRCDVAGRVRLLQGACDAAEGDACHPPAGLPGRLARRAGTVEPAAATGAYGIWNGSRSAGGGPVCYACPAHGTCRGHYDLPRPARHYATVDYRGVDRRTLADSWKRIDCRADFGGACESDFGCAPGQASRGLLCQRIATGETNIGDLAVRCRGSGGATTYVFQLALTLGMVVCFFFINYLSDQFSALGIFLTHGRSLAIISSVHVVWPRDPVLSFLFGALEATQFDVDVAPPRCVFATWGFRERLALQCGLALGMVAYYVVMELGRAAWRVRRAMRREKRGAPTDAEVSRLETAKNTSVKLGVLALLMNYPSLCEDLTLRCGSPKHVSVVVAAALILPVVVGIPAVVFFVLYKHIRRNTLNSARCLERWGPLYEGLRPGYAWWNAVELAKQFWLEAGHQLLRASGPEVMLLVFTLMQFVHILAIDLVRPHLHRSEALLERTLIATAVVIIAVAAVFAAYGDDPSPAQDARKQALAVVLDVCLLAYRGDGAARALPVDFGGRVPRRVRRGPVVRDGRHRTSSAAAAVKRALGGAERDARTYDFSPDVYATFKPHLILKWARRADRDARTLRLIEDLIYVDAHVVAECCGDGHDVSTYSISPESSVWRTLTDAFPALFEWLANERSDDAVKQFGALVGRIVELRKRYRYGVAAVDAKWTFSGRAATAARDAVHVADAEAPDARPLIGLIEKEDRAPLVRFLVAAEPAVRLRFFNLLRTFREELVVVIEEAEKAEKAGRDADDLRRLSMERTRDANAGPVDDGKPAPFFFDEAISAFTHSRARRGRRIPAPSSATRPRPYRNVDLDGRGHRGDEAERIAPARARGGRAARHTGTARSGMTPASSSSSAKRTRQTSSPPTSARPAAATSAL
ncbi:hypothetical protein JL722_11769 [Aureococcus anophagefferens]|nr:hypothetical protein JL722_11769 [Aureococcus anophagefferens]